MKKINLYKTIGTLFAYFVISMRFEGLANFFGGIYQGFVTIMLDITKAFYSLLETLPLIGNLYPYISAFFDNIGFAINGMNRTFLGAAFTAVVAAEIAVFIVNKLEHAHLLTKVKNAYSKLSSGIENIIASLKTRI